MNTRATLLLAFLLPLAVSAQTWMPQTSGTTADLSDVHFLDATTGFATADAGLLFSTSDGGATWISRVFGVAFDFEGVAFNPSGTVGLIATDDGPVFRTTDGGATWLLISTGASDLRHVAWAGDEAVWVAGREGSAAVSTDGGQTWASRPSGSLERTESIAAVSATEAWVVGRGGEIRHTTDGGLTWVAQFSGTASDLNDIQMLDASTGYAAGSGNVVLKTTNGGATWTNVATAGVSGNGLFFTDADRGWVVGDAGQVWFTADGGATWALQPSGVTAAFNRVHFPTADDGWAVGDAGTIVAFGTTVASEPGSAPFSFALAPAYPNPFNPQTTLRITMPESGPARVAVYDALGREVALLLNDRVTEGTHEVVFEAAGLPSGSYLVRLTTSTGVHSRAVTLLR